LPETGFEGWPAFGRVLSSNGVQVGTLPRRGRLCPSGALCHRAHWNAIWLSSLPDLMSSSHAVLSVV